ncbi:thiol-disulfide oxidoreductase DCC family protein [Alicyclobacillus ferrooxydans]|uniref:Thiol-disulfide oxidoreductase DCC n=1 Tax=Alicyclobacillus ferrooxydans TaxID=471514 RepID=A0A0P9CGB7_9BACL|nr:DCC1-like thiol-disulfide oxidoreductase family protein [Alicyclobacillus ferrooxydans]KPV44596.1 hypothetical protein AN477_06265 [Alicyclobacillus ferrooxydans]
MRTDEEGPILLFDGVCNLCNGAVKFVIKRDPEARVRFAPLQSAIGQRLTAALSHGRSLNSVILFHEGRVYTESSAILRTLYFLRWPWPSAFVLLIVPSVIRDGVYRYIAAHRYRWFGRRESCMVPSADISSRFLVDD